ncbi:hypothetical protein TNCV_735471 [Trichonephila clavipes]|uniref:Uncharacterized protein n=1 Tax=Trichonephila clavipes TaxID=2585209 RepID=A0A8X6T184_TRICX|nr:hypothetical protein TNCV_735471 [Trichonephila clavipes]
MSGLAARWLFRIPPCRLRDSNTGPTGKLQPRLLGCSGKPLMVMLWENPKSTSGLPVSNLPTYQLKTRHAFDEKK